MGYTHYWNRHDHTGATTHARAHAREAYGRLVLDAQRICRQAMENGIVICGALGEGEPDFTEGYFALNGTILNDEWHESMVWEAIPTVPEWQAQGKHGYDMSEGVFTFCKTAYKPYDAVVTAILLRAKYHYGELVSLRSDGTWNEWLAGRELYRQVFSETALPYE